MSSMIRKFIVIRETEKSTELLMASLKGDLIKIVIEESE
jgi:hypothetical protein